MLKLKRANLQTLELVVKQKNFYGYGCGLYPRKFSERHPQSTILENLLGVCDSDRQKVGQNIIYGRKRRTVISLDELSDRIAKEDGLLITSITYLPIIEMLDKMEAFDGIECYILSIAECSRKKASEQEVLNIQKYFSREKKIPKVIHYCWFGDKEISEEQKTFIKGWKDLCPDYEVICWNEDNYDITGNLYMYEAYKAGKYGFVVDYARLDILYQYGGIYLDTDVEMVRNMDDLLSFDAFAGYQNDSEVALGLGFGAKKGSDIIEWMREKYVGLHFCNGNEFNLTPSPVYQTQWLKELGLKGDGSFQLIKGMGILPQEYLSGMIQSIRMLDITDHTYLIHHFAGTWKNEKEIEKDTKLKKQNTFIYRRMT